MLPRSHSTARRRPSPAAGVAAPLCAFTAALLIFLSIAVLYYRLSSSPLPFPSLSNPSPISTDIDSPLLRDETENPTLDAADLIDELDFLDEDSGAHTDGAGAEADSLGFLKWDHAAGAARIPFGGRSAAAGFAHPRPLGDSLWVHFASDDEPVGLELRARVGAAASVEEMLLLKPEKGKEPVGRQGWARWLEGKADYLRRDHMLKSNLEALHPRSHPLLQDPDMPGITTLSRGDRLIQRALLVELEKTPWEHGKKGGKEERSEDKVSGGKDDQVAKGGQRDHRRWGYFPGIDPHLQFTEFVNKFFDGGSCALRVFMVWNSPPWTYGVRHQRSLESLLRVHPDGCVVMLSETLDLNFFQDFVNEGYKVSVAFPNLDELLGDTPAQEFASVWFEWRKARHYPLHYSELVRLAALYKFGGIYMDSDIIVLKSMNSLHDTIGVEEERANGNSTYSGAVMAFRKHSPFLMECMREFHSTYDDDLLKWNGADLLARVIKTSGGGNKSHEKLDIKIQPPEAFYPISSKDVMRYFAEPVDEDEKLETETLLSKILNESITIHLWNSITSSLVPEPGSLVDRLLNRYCLRCNEVL